MTARKIAVTGARGFLGSHLVRRAAADGATVVAIGRASAPGVISSEDVLRDPSALDGTDVFIHSAAIRHRHGSAAKAYRASNVDLVEALFRAAAGRIGRFVFVSSVGIYGFPADLPVRETTKLAPRTLYSQTKIEAEKLVRELGRKLDLPFTIVRPSIFYGQGDTNGMLDKLVAMIRARRYLLVGDGNNVLHHTHVDDVVDATFALAESERARNDDFIVAGPETTTLRRLSEDVAARLGRKLPPLHVPLAIARAASTMIELARYRGLAFERNEPPLNHEKLDVMTVPIAFDTTKLRGIGIVPRVGYAEGLARTIPSPSLG